MVKQLFIIISFYSRFLLSFSNIGYLWRKRSWRFEPHDFRGQTWLVTGASGGIGKAVVEGAIKGGANVIAVARSEQKLAALKQSIPVYLVAQVQTRVVDLSLQREIKTLLEQLQADQIQIDVLINNVGVLLDDMEVTEEGVETSFATNLLNHYQLTQAMLQRQMLSDDAVVVNVTSGGLYNVPLSIENLDVQTDAYNGVFAYSYHKRAQAVLTQHWRDKYSAGKRSFYAMHPGWVDTQGVKDSLPTFRKVLKSVLRGAGAGADTILWLVAQRPQQTLPDAVWFDRKQCKAHCFSFTQQSSDDSEALTQYLESRLICEQTQ